MVRQVLRGRTISMINETGIDRMNTDTPWLIELRLNSLCVRADLTHVFLLWTL